MVKGKKTYSETLRCANLVTSELDGIRTVDALKKNVPANITSNKTFKNIVVKGNVNSSLNRLDRVNGVQISDLLEKFVSWDKPQKLNFLKFKNIQGNSFCISSNFLEKIISFPLSNGGKDLNFFLIPAKNLRVTTYNDLPVEEFLSDQEKLNNIDKIKNLIIPGNLSINTVKNVVRINDILVEKLIEKVCT